MAWHGYRLPARERPALRLTGALVGGAGIQLLLLLLGVRRGWVPSVRQCTSSSKALRESLLAAASVARHGPPPSPPTRQARRPSDGYGSARTRCCAGAGRGGRRDGGGRGGHAARRAAWAGEKLCAKLRELEEELRARAIVDTITKRK